MKMKKIFIYFFIFLLNLIMICAMLPTENGPHEIMHGEGASLNVPKINASASSMPKRPMNGMNDLNAIEVERTAIVNMREALGNKLGQIDYDIAALQNDPTQLENVHKLFTQRIQIGQHLSALYEKIKWLNQREKEIRKFVDRAGKRQKNQQEAENTQIENIDSDSDSDVAKKLEQEINDIPTVNEARPKRKQPEINYIDNSFPEFVNSDVHKFKNIVQQFTSKESNTSPNAKPKRKFKNPVTKKSNNDIGKTQLQHEHPPQLVSEKEINELNAIMAEKEKAIAKRDLLGKNLNLVGNQIAKLLDDPTQQQQLQSLLERRSKITFEITLLFDKLKLLMRREKELREMIKHVPVPAEPMQMPKNYEENNHSNQAQIAKQSENEIVNIAAVDGPSNQENENLFGIPINYLNGPIPDQNGIHHHDPNEQNGHASFPMDQSNNNEQQVNHQVTRQTFMESQLQMVLTKLNEKHNEKAHLISTKNGNDLELLLQQIHKLQEQAAAIERRIYFERGLLPRYPENTLITVCGPAFGQCLSCDEILCKVYESGCKWSEMDAYCTYKSIV